MKYYVTVIGYDKVDSNTGNLTDVIEVSVYAPNPVAALKKAKQLTKSKNWLVRLIKEVEENEIPQTLNKILKKLHKL